jgi:hypothetical protein
MPEDANTFPVSGYQTSGTRQDDTSDNKEAPAPTKENQTPEKLPNREFQQQTVPPEDLPADDFQDEEEIPKDLDDEGFLPEKTG